MTDTKRKDGPGSAELSDLELEVMNIVWRLGECSSAEVIAELRKERDLADTTVRTVLANIRKKGYIEPIPTVERGFRLKPKVPRSKVAGRTMHKLVGRLFNGSSSAAIMHLIRNEDVSDEELEQIRRMLDAQSRSEKPG